MSPMTYAEFEAEARTQGFDEVLERVWPPGQVIGAHTHPFAVKALVVQGDLWLNCDGDTRHLQSGDRFELAMNLPHEERYGPAGATFWVARKYPSA